MNLKSRECMKQAKHSSLGDRISSKISAWIFTLVIAIIVGLFSISFSLSKQMFNKQVNIWQSATPQYALTSLIESDNFSIKREIEFLKATGLFSSFLITDNQKRVISQFGNVLFSGSELIPIKDEAGAVWGYYFFKTDFYRFFSFYLIFAVIFLGFILLAYFTIRWRIRCNLEAEFSRFNHFLSEIELVTEKLNEFYDKEVLLINPALSFDSEQVIINKAISRLMNEIKKANKSFHEAISFAEKRRFQDELTKTALQVAHDIGSPLGVLEMVVQSTSFVLPEKSRIEVRNAAGRIRDITNTLLKKAKHDLLSQDDDPISKQSLHYLVSQVVSEKRMQHGSIINFENTNTESMYSIFALIRAGEFCSVLSNVINNSIEALDDQGQIEISLHDLDKLSLIKIQDNGKGIPDEVLKTLGKLGKTHGKTDGSGLGLYNAINKIDEWSGQFEIQSKEQVGTTVHIYLPKAQPPSWFVPEIKLKKGK